MRPAPSGSSQARLSRLRCMARQSARSSDLPISLISCQGLGREFPATQAARIAESLLWTRSWATGRSQTRVRSEILHSDAGVVHRGRMTGRGHSRIHNIECSKFRLGRIAAVSVWSLNRPIPAENRGTDSRELRPLCPQLRTFGRPIPRPANEKRRPRLPDRRLMSWRIHTIPPPLS